jgi:hypothetical protein
MSKQSDNKAVVGRWFTEFWGKDFNPSVIDELASPDMLLKYSLHEPRRGRADIKAFITDFQVAFPDLNFWGTADLIAEGTMLSANGRAAERIRVLLLVISSWAAYRPQAAARCVSLVQQFSKLSTAKSLRKSAWTTASPR